MWPCFQEGDLLEVEPVAIDRLRVGDCVLFPDHAGQLVAHRLIDKHDGLRTRGDATTIPDPYKVLPRDIRGRIICRHRLGQRNRVTGGRLGLLASVCYRYAGRIDPDRPSRGGRIARAIRRLTMVALKPIWRLGKIRKLLGPEQEPQVVWMLGKVVIGRQVRPNGEWQIRWPWRIFIEPDVLQARGKE